MSLLKTQIKKPQNCNIQREAETTVIFENNSKKHARKRFKLGMITAHLTAGK